MRKFIPILLCSIALTISTSACECNFEGSFLKVAPNALLISFVKVKKFLSFKDIYGKQTPMSMEVEIADTYKGNEARKIITVWGDPGNLCRPYLSSFEEGKYYVIAFIKAGRGLDEPATDYAISVCGTYWLSANKEKGTATGNINSEDNKPTTMKLEELKAKLVAQ